VTLSYTATSHADPDAVWALLARPDRWREWAPHVRGAWGLGDPEVANGRRGAVRLLPAIPVPVRVLAKQPGRSWAWRVGPVTIAHRVEPRGEHCRVAIDIDAPAGVEAVLAVSYGPLVHRLVRNLARVAASPPC
jgi:hypothetical protein